MSTVIGIFEDQFKKKIPLTVVRPGSQSRRFTHINDTVEAAIMLGKKISVSIIVYLIEKVIQLLKLQNCLILKLSFLPPREGERYASALTNMNLSNKVYKMFGKIDLKDYSEILLKITKKNYNSLFTIYLF